MRENIISQLVYYGIEIPNDCKGKKSIVKVYHSHNYIYYFISYLFYRQGSIYWHNRRSILAMFNFSLPNFNSYPLYLHLEVQEGLELSKYMHCAHQLRNTRYGSIFWLGRFSKLHV